MRKISKISLVAAVAVAGFSTANAQPLEEAIKNVDVSGSVVYRYDNFHNAEKTGSNGAVTSPRTDGDSGKNNYKIGLNLSSKVNDYVKFNSRFIVGSKDNGGFTSLGSGRNYTSNATPAQNTNRGSDGQADVSLSNAYFGLTAIPNTVVNIGKQGLATPYTVATDINGNEQTGTGILALTNVGPVTAGLGYFNNTNLNASTEINASQDLGVGSSTKTFATGESAYGLIDGGSDMYVATVQGDLDFVKLEAWYAGLQETFNTYTLAATSNLDLAENAKLGLEARYVNLKLKQDFVGANTETKNDMFRFAVDGKFSIVNARLAYTKTGKNGGLTALDQDAKNTSLGWAITSNGAVDADYFQAALGADILDNLNFTLHYGKIKAKDQTNSTKNFAINLTDYKAQEVYGQLTYKMSKNLTTYLRYGTYEEKEVSSGDKEMDQTRGRIQVAYTF
ncbi:major outer membrane protein [Aliarcobacter cryaerophilus]|uniref:major outer membrane protein n=1 Tax=Aliarcobacter cryaerophilus TaxID=28198 RepID=UPI0021B59D1D|nr:major outer membrane protein [Aliarcobacter cryaerophilus]MCT7545638.1 major outer membrane protein [Aliarcobacter cryaerophilus]